jgi:cobalt-zinc-cadmium efflux system protein
MLAERFGIDHVTLQPDWHLPSPGKRVIPVALTPTDKAHLR